MSATILKALSGTLLGVSLATATAPAQGGDGSRDTTVTYVEQPAGIDLADYVTAWPALGPYVVRLRLGVRALRMANDGVGMGQKAFYVVRADVHRLRGERTLAFADYDRAIEERVFKLNAFLAAADLAAEQQDWPRARRYLEWAVHCRPDSPTARAKLAALPGQ